MEILEQSAQRDHEPEVQEERETGREHEDLLFEGCGFGYPQVVLTDEIQSIIGVHGYLRSRSF